jgi:hypothetical protein
MIAFVLSFRRKPNEHACASRDLSTQQLATETLSVAAIGHSFGRYPFYPYKGGIARPMSTHIVSLCRTTRYLGDSPESGPILEGEHHGTVCRQLCSPPGWG